METEQKKQEVQEIENEILDSIIEIRSDPVIKDETENFPWTMYVSKNDNRNVYSLYLYDEIYDPQYYSKLFEIIRKLQENDALDIHLNSPGGSLTTLVAFVNVLQESDATVTMYIDGFAESAAAILAFTGDELVIREHLVSCFIIFILVESSFRIVAKSRLILNQCIVCTNIC